jgi:hypothetical protein
VLWIFSKLCESCERIKENPNCESGLFKSGGFFFILLAGEFVGRRSLERPRRRWGTDVKMDPHELDRRGMAQDGGRWRDFVNVVTNLQVL